MATPKPASQNGDQTIEALQARFQQLNTRKIQAETSLGHAQQQLAALQKEAREKYGTDDLAELRAKLEQMKAENEAQRKKYQAELDRIEGELAAIETKFAAAEGTPPGGTT